MPASVLVASVAAMVTLVLELEMKPTSRARVAPAAKVTVRAVVPEA